MTMGQRTAVARLAAGTMAVVFAAVGLVFLFAPGSVVRFFNAFSGLLGTAPAPVAVPSLFTALAAAYMYVVTFLAVSLARRPSDRAAARLLVHAKLVSSLVSLGLFIAHRPYLVLLANAVVDGLIGAAVHVLYRRVPDAERRAGPGTGA